MSAAPERLEVVVRGRVQGVAFRWYTRQEAQRLGRGRSNYEQMWEESRAAHAEVLGMALESDIDDRDRLREIAIAAGLRCGACDGEGEIDLGDPARSDAAIERVAGCQACSGVGWALPVPGGEGCPSRCAPGLCDDCDEDIAY